MEIHELNTFSGTLGAGDYFATDNGSDTSKVSAEDMLGPLNARIDNIIAGGDAPSASEVTDARLGATALGLKKYSSLGAAIRGQATDLFNDITVLRDAFGVNLLDPDALIPNIFLNSTTGAEESSNYYWATGFIPVSGIYTIKPFEYSGSARVRLYKYKQDQTFDSRNVFDPASYPNGYTFSYTGYIRLNIDNGANDSYENPQKYMLVKGSSADGVADTFVPYYTACDKTARNNLTNELKNFVKNYSATYSFTDLNDITENSIYYVSPNVITDNYPTGLGAAYLETVKMNDSNYLQMAFSAYGTSAYMRACVHGVWRGWTKIQMGQEIVDTEETSSISLFESVGCCGDSFTAGYLYNKTDSPWYDPDYVPNGEYPKIGYPAVMGRLYGIDVTAFAKGGLTSTQWRTDSAGLPALLADDPKNLYIIALGLNDKTQDVPIGIEDDIDTEPGTPTFLGNMGAIIRAIQSHAPMAKIILCKSLWVYNEGTARPNTYYNYISEGVELLSSHLGIPYLETLDDPYFCSDAYVNGLKGLHPTAPLYAGMGRRIGEMVGKCIIDNPHYFYNFYIPN